MPDQVRYDVLIYLVARLIATLVSPSNPPTLLIHTSNPHLYMPQSEKILDSRQEILGFDRFFHKFIDQFICFTLSVTV